MNINNTIATLAKNMSAAKAELQKERANKDHILRPFAHKGLDDSFDFPDEYYDSVRRIRDIMDYGAKCQKAIDLLKEIEGSEFNFEFTGNINN